MTSVLCLHGGGLNGQMWSPQIDDLSHTVDIHVLDLPGHGERSEECFTFDRAVEAIHRYTTAQVEGKVVLVGSSLGGYVAIAFAYRYPQRVSKLLLSGCSVQYFGLLGFFAACNVLILKGMSADFFQRVQKRQLLKIASPTVVERITERGVSFSGARESM